METLCGLILEQESELHKKYNLSVIVLDQLYFAPIHGVCKKIILIGLRIVQLKIRSYRFLKSNFRNSLLN